MELGRSSQNRSRFGRRTALVVAALMGTLLACSFSAQPTAEIILEPTVRSGPASLPPTLPPELPISPPATTATTPEPIAPSVFRDDFDGTALGPGWSWWKSDSPGWSLSHMSGWLRLNLSTGSFFGATPPGNLLVRPAPSADFDAETGLRFSPFQNFELAGLVVVFDDDSVLQFGRAFCEGSAACIGDGLYFDNIQDGSVVDGNFATQSFLGVDYVLRLQRQGNNYSASYSTDGSTWTTVGSHTVDRPPALIGLIAAQAVQPGNFADFDFFQVTG